jgi:hypothetical protein
MAEEKEQKSQFGERMGDISGMRVLRDGKWIPLSQISKPVQSKPKETKKAVTASSYLQTVLRVPTALEPVLADADYGDKCPPATQDIVLNIKNRQNAIDNVGYGPLNPEEPSLEFWQDKADKWSVTIADAKKSRCGNCVFFDRRPKTLDCIEEGLASGGSGDESAWDAIDQAELGYCTALDFKCAASRTCNAWAVGGPITEDVKPVAAAGTLVPEEQDLAKALIEIADKYGKFNEDQTGIWADYHEPEDNPYAEMGVKCGNCVLYRGGEECAVVAFAVHPEGYCRFAVLPDGSVDPSKAPEGTKPFEQHDILTATVGSKPAPKKDRIKGSSKNPKGSASGSKSINFSKKVEASLSEKVKNHNEKAPDGRKASLRMLKAVYRRGAGAFSTSHRPDQNRNSWAMARVNAFLHLLKSGSPKNSKYTTDNDLLPASHPKSSKKSLAASATVEYDYNEELSVVLLSETEYTNKEHAIFSLAEFSKGSYEIMPALHAAWLRAEKAGENPYSRVTDLAINLYESRDSDLLPKEF